jgi:hypothetical protein
MDPLRSDMRPAEALSGPERDARIEQLLLAGLDEYFAHRYEHAINLWTRVLFFDRQHDRARAYIERARRAQAERQRESEAALHQAIDAFRAGDIARARMLVTDALDRGASPDEAHGMLERIERLGIGSTSPKARRKPVLPPLPWSGGTPQPVAGPRPLRMHGVSAPLLLIVAAIGIFGVALWGLTTPDASLWSSSSPAPSPAAIPWAQEPLPVAQSSEFVISRARHFVATGRVHDALALLDRVPVGDSLRDEADRIRADAQAQLLSLAASERSRE